MSYLALDVGDRRIGVAGADPEGIVVTPLTTFTRRSDRQVVAAITALAADRGAETLVVGLPYTPQGEIGEQAQRVQDFARRLEQVPGLTVVYWDERYSTLEARDRLRETGGRRRRRGRPARRRARALGCGRSRRDLAGRCPIRGLNERAEQDRPAGSYRPFKAPVSSGQHMSIC